MQKYNNEERKESHGVPSTFNATKRRMQKEGKTKCEIEDLGQNSAQYERTLKTVSVIAYINDMFAADG